MRTSKAAFRMIVLWACLIASPTWAGTIVSVDFNSPAPWASSPTFSGVEPAAAAADPLFAAANIWNGLDAPCCVLDTNLAWSGLVNSTGGATTVGFSITGTVIGVSEYDPVQNPDALRADFLAWNSNSTTLPGESTTIDWLLMGLVPNTTYDMAVYGARADYTRNFDMTIQGVTQNVPTLLFTNPQPSGVVLFRDLLSSPSGTISGVGTGIGSPVGAANEANWAGFQIAATPEPSTLLLLSTGALGLLGMIRGRSIT